MGGAGKVTHTMGTGKRSKCYNNRAFSQSLSPVKPNKLSSLSLAVCTSAALAVEHLYSRWRNELQARPASLSAHRRHHCHCRTQSYLTPSRGFLHCLPLRMERLLVLEWFDGVTQQNKEEKEEKEDEKTFNELPADDDSAASNFTSTISSFSSFSSPSSSSLPPCTLKPHTEVCILWCC